MRDHVPSMRTTLIGRTLKRWMDAEGLHKSEVARRLGVSPSRVSRLLSGKRGANPADIGGIAALCHIGATERDQVLRLAENLRDDTWVQPTQAGPPGDLDAIHHAEQHARHLTVFQPDLVPDLLQVAAYTRLLLRSHPPVTEQEMERRIRLHQDRRTAALNPHEARGERARQPAQFQFLLPERVLRQTGLEPRLQQEQLGHLLQAGLQPNVDIRILPTSASTVRAGHPFYLCEFEEQRTAVCLANLNSVTVLEDDATVTGYHELAAKLRAAAMDPDESRAFLSSAAASHRPTAHV